MMNKNEIIATNIFDLISKYYKNYDYIIEYGENNRISIRKDTLIGYDTSKNILYYYANNTTDEPPLGAILVSSITAIKRREG